eukprot:Gb_37551 [translate_table: standard]
MAIEKDNDAYIKPFTKKFNYNKFQTSSILVHPYHAKGIHSSVNIMKLDVSYAEGLYRDYLCTKKKNSQDIDAILKNKLSLGT